MERLNVQKTFVPKPEDINPEWILVDAEGQTLGRVAAKVAAALLGKHKPGFTPGVLMGDFVIIVNAERIQVTGNKLEDKFYSHHSGYPGGLKTISLRHQLERHPDRVLRAAVWGMLPHNKFGHKLIKRLKVYAGSEHPHAAQSPKAI